MVTFDKLGLSEQILKVLPELGFETPTEIQKLAIPKLIAGNRDFIGQAQTGTGKTAAFGLPLLDLIDQWNDSTQALILAPTRELCLQITEHLNHFSKYLEHINVLAVYGGSSISAQIRALKKAQHIIVATPGRLIDLVKRKALKIDAIQFLVLDEADEMLNMGFKEELDTILAFTPKEKITWLFSATLPQTLKKIIQSYMNKALEVKVNVKKVININIEHQYAIINQNNKTEALCRLLDDNKDIRALVFCRTKVDTQQLADDLRTRNYKVGAIHGDIDQRQRTRVMSRFKKHQIPVLVATDVAARGIDVTDLSHVFHYSLPDDIEYYTHRSGRTARAGKKGISLALISRREKHRIDRLSNKLDIVFHPVKIPIAEDITNKKIEEWCLNILQTKTKDKLDSDLLDKVNLIFGNLSKEELTAKIIMQEVQNLDVSQNGDLNVKSLKRMSNLDRIKDQEEKTFRKKEDGIDIRNLNGIENDNFILT